MGGTQQGAVISVASRPAWLALSDDGRLLADLEPVVCPGATTNQYQIWDVPEGRRLWSIPAADEHHLAAFSPAGRELIVGSNSFAFILNATNGQPIGRPCAHQVEEVLPWVVYVDFHPDGRHFVTCSADNLATKCYAQLWDVASGQRWGQELPQEDGVLSACFSGDGGRLLTSGEDRSAFIWEVKSSKHIGRVLHHLHQVQSAVFDPTDSIILTASTDETARLWDAATGDPLTPPLRVGYGSWGGQFLPGGSRIAIWRADRSTIWPLPTEDRPVGDVVDLARLLSCDAGLRDVVEPSLLRRQSLEKVWRRLRTAYPAQFSVTDTEACAWHTARFEEALKERDDYGMAFHAGWLHGLHPDDSGILRRCSLGALARLAQNQPGDVAITAALAAARQLTSN